MRWIAAAVSTAVVLGASASAQTNERETVSNGRAWYMYFGDHPLGESPWGFHFDGQLRMEGGFDRRNQLSMWLWHVRLHKVEMVGQAARLVSNAEERIHAWNRTTLCARLSTKRLWFASKFSDAVIDDIVETE